MDGPVDSTELDGILKTLSEFKDSLISHAQGVIVIVVFAMLTHYISKAIIKRAFSWRIRQAAQAAQAAQAGLADNASHEDFTNAHLEHRKVETARAIVLGMCRYGIIAVAVLSILSFFNVNLASILTVAGVGGLAIGIGAQSLVRDILNGAFIWFEDQFAIGDKVTIGAVTGTVEGFNMRTTRVRCENGDLCVIPNSSITVVANSSKGYKRAIVDVGVPGGADIGEAIAAVGAAFDGAMQSIEGLLEKIHVEGVQSFAGNVVDAGAVIRISVNCMPASNEQVEREMRRRALVALEALGHCGPQADP